MQAPRRLETGDKLDAFDCGNKALNTFLESFALQNQKNGSGITYVVTDQDRVVAFYTVASGSISHDNAPSRLKKGLPKHPVSTIVLGRFAVDKTHQGKKIGMGLLKDAMLRVIQASEVIGVRAIVVDAKDEKSRAFYEKFDFTRFTEDGFRLYLLTKDVRKLLEG